jgi:hypothetical protein
MVFSGLSRAFHYPIHLITFYLLLWNYLLILNMLTKTLLSFLFSVIGRCSLVPTSHWQQGKLYFIGSGALFLLIFLFSVFPRPMATTHPDPISTYEAGQWIFLYTSLRGHFISHTQNWFQMEGGRIGGLQNFLSN